MSEGFSEGPMELMGDERTRERVGEKVGARVVVRKIIEQKPLLDTLLNISTCQRE